MLKIQFYIFTLEQFCPIQLQTIPHGSFVIFLHAFFPCYHFFHSLKEKDVQVINIREGLRIEQDTGFVLKYNFG